MCSHAVHTLRKWHTLTTSAQSALPKFCASSFSPEAGINSCKLSDVHWPFAIGSKAVESYDTKSGRVVAEGTLVQPHVGAAMVMPLWRVTLGQTVQVNGPTPSSPDPLEAQLAGYDTQAVVQSGMGSMLAGIVQTPVASMCSESGILLMTSFPS
jgi:hypothetical protein